MPLSCGLFCGLGEGDQLRLEAAWAGAVVLLGSEFISTDKTVASIRRAGLTEDLYAALSSAAMKGFCPGQTIKACRQSSQSQERGSDFPLSIFLPVSFKLLQSFSVLEYWQFNRVLLSHRSVSIRQLLEPAVKIRSHLTTIEDNQRCH